MPSDPISFRRIINQSQDSLSLPSSPHTPSFLHHINLKQKGQSPEQLSFLDMGPSYVPAQPDLKESGVKRELCSSQASQETESQMKWHRKLPRKLPKRRNGRRARWETRPSYEFQSAVKHLDKLCHRVGKGKGHPHSYYLKALESDNVLSLAMPLWLMAQRTSHLKWKRSRVWGKQPALFSQSLQVSFLVLMRWDHQPKADLRVFISKGISLAY